MKKQSISIKPMGNPNTIQQVEEGRELTDEELEKVIGGASREFFLKWAADIYNDHRKDKHDKQIDEERTRTRND